MPDSDRGKKQWMERFIAEVERDPQRYSFGDALRFEYIQRTIRTFIKAAEAASNPGTRSPSATIAKNQARAKAVAMCRELAMRLKWDPTLSDDQKRALGIHTDQAPPDDAKLPQGVITGTLGYPALAVLSSPNGGHVIRYRDITSPSKAKPKGVSHLLLFAAIGEKPNMRRTHARLLGAYTKRPFEIMYPMGCGIEGLYVTYYGRWLTTRGKMSPWSPGVSRIIGETQTSLRDSEFGHLFGTEGFIDALPQGLARGRAHVEAEDRPLLQSVASDGDGLFAALEAKMGAKMLPWQAFAMLEQEVARGDSGRVAP
jgi:hypothetical protein